MEKQYLSLKEQFKKILNNTEITSIEDYELREIRQNHWNYRHKILILLILHNLLLVIIS